MKFSLVGDGVRRSLSCAILTATSISSQSVVAEEKMKYFLMIAEPNGATWKALIEGGGNMADAARPAIEAMGGELISYYVGATEAKNYGIIAFPDSMDIAKITYLRAAEGVMKNMQFIEVIPSDEAVGLFADVKNTLE